LDRHRFGWNEEELKMFFIGPLLDLVDFDGPNYNVFAGRRLAAKVGEYELSGIVDGPLHGVDTNPSSPTSVSMNTNLRIANSLYAQQV
jgi:hypothetical protein